MKKIFFTLLILSIPHLCTSMDRRLSGQAKQPLTGGIKKPVIGKKIAPPLATKDIIQSLNNGLWHVATAEEIVKKIISNPSNPTKQTLITETQTSLKIGLDEIQHAVNMIKILEPYNKDTKNYLVDLITTISANMTNDIKHIKILTQYSSEITSAFMHKLEQYKVAIVDVWDLITFNNILTPSSIKQIQQTTEILHGNGMATVCIEKTPNKQNHYPSPKQLPGL